MRLPWGRTEDDGAGNVSVLTPAYIILVHVHTLLRSPSTKASIRSFREVGEVAVDARHDIFDELAGDFATNAEVVAVVGAHTIAFRACQSESRLQSAGAVSAALGLLIAGR